MGFRSKPTQASKAEADASAVPQKNSHPNHSYNSNTNSNTNPHPNHNSPYNPFSENYDPRIYSSNDQKPVEKVSRGRQFAFTLMNGIAGMSFANGAPGGAGTGGYLGGGHGGGGGRGVDGDRGC